MNTKHISLAALAIVAVLAGCTKNPIEAPSDSNRFSDLELTSVNSVQTKAAIDGTAFPTNGKIGLSLFADETADTPYGDGYANVEYSYNGNKGKWTASPSIKVGSTPGYLYGYYPYNGESTDIKAVPVVSSLNGDDVMYATSQTVTDKTASQTAITMNHALARVAVTVVNKGYTGAAKLSSIKFAGAETSASGTLNAINGNITATKADVTLDVPAASQDITAAGTTYDCLLVPSAEDESKQAVSLTLTIDGEAKTANLSDDNGVIIAQNTKSNITITLSNSGISVQTVSVEDWTVVEVGRNKVTVDYADAHNIEKDVLVTAYADGNTARIVAFSQSGRALFCTIDGGGTCTRTEADNIYTFIISDITSDVAATIGYQALPDGALPDVFTVNASGKIVCFSKGNLQATFDSGTYSWGFAANQYDYIGDSAGNTSIDTQTNGAVVDLFGWSTAATNYGILTSEDNADYYGEYVDWGNNIGDGCTWHTLDTSEWKYLFETRKMMFVDFRHTVDITYNGCMGIVLYPDNYYGSALTPEIEYTDDTFPDGCVFLPAASYRCGSYVYFGTYCMYWSSSACDDENAYCVYYQRRYAVPHMMHERSYGLSVRLVTDVK